MALTGSSGKTSVKEMTAAILSQCGNTLYTAGNLNNDIGVPMTLLRLTHEHEYAVIELGANHQGEIARTVSLTRPEAALVNNGGGILKVLVLWPVWRKRKVKFIPACRMTASPL